jgi:hypothetical protein
VSFGNPTPRNQALPRTPHWDKALYGEAHKEKEEAKAVVGRLDCFYFAQDELSIPFSRTRTLHSTMLTKVVFAVLCGIAAAQVPALDFAQGAASYGMEFAGTDNIFTMGSSASCTKIDGSTECITDTLNSLQTQIDDIITGVTPPAPTPVDYTSCVVSTLPVNRFVSDRVLISVSFTEPRCCPPV